MIGNIILLPSKKWFLNLQDSISLHRRCKDQLPPWLNLNNHSRLIIGLWPCRILFKVLWHEYSHSDDTCEPPGIFLQFHGRASLSSANADQATSVASTQRTSTPKAWSILVVGGKSMFCARTRTDLERHKVLLSQILLPFTLNGAQSPVRAHNKQAIFSKERIRRKKL